MNKYRVLITGAGSTLGQSIFKALARSHHSANIELFVINSDAPGAAFYFNYSGLRAQHVEVCPQARDQGYKAYIHDFVRKHKIDIVYSGTQHELKALATYNEDPEHAAYGICAIPTLKTVESCFDKQKTIDLLTRHSLGAPGSCRLSDYLKSSLMTLELPVVIKPIHSSASRSIYICKTEKELSDVVIELKALSRFDPNDFVMQEFLDGPEYTCAVYLDRYSRSTSTLVFLRSLSKVGASSEGQIEYDKNIEAYLCAVTEAFRKEGFEFGNLNIQLRTTSTGPKLFEINGRLSSTEAPKAYFGFNSVEAYFDNIVLKIPSKIVQPPRSGKFLRYHEEVYDDENLDI